MAYAITTSGAIQNGLAARLNEVVISLRASAARRRVYKQTMAELRALSTRELADMGIARGEIRRVAYEAAYQV